jgi:carboxypeptidase Taq
MANSLGVVSPDDSRGVMQEIHWSEGAIGYFPCYAVGNIMSGQFYKTALDADPTIPDRIASGHCENLHRWLTENIWKHGARYFPDELIIRSTGRPLEAFPYLNYLRDKYSNLYGIDI